MNSIELRVPDDDDIAAMWRIESAGDIWTTWRAGGSTIGLEEFRSNFWTGVLAQWVVVSSAAPQHLRGLVVFYDYNAWDGYCRAGYCSYTPLGVTAAAGLAMAIDRIFDDLPLRKVYFDTVGANRPTPGGTMSRFCRKEGTVREYGFVGGEWTDLEVWSIDRDTWVREPRRLIRGTGWPHRN